LVALGLLSALSLWLSALPWWAALMAAAVAVTIAAHEAQLQASQPRCSLVWQGGSEEASVNFADRSESWHSVKASFRGSIVALSGVDAEGRTQRLIWWPDTLDARERRRFRLAASELQHASKTPLH